ncbi:MAG: hypothetical protein MJ116_00290 [Lachnospiraceae bacterium]|nr:hypothetical protein [Lachnospiraceae bacterium]
MAKFLRFIFNLLLICYIAAALALFVPPLVGVKTAVTVEGTVGNQELGSVNYAWRTPLKELQPGEKILVEEAGSVNVYSIDSVDTENITVTTTDGITPTVRTYAYKLVLTIPYLGYIAIALQTMEGMIILGAIAGVLLLLCILTAIWCRKKKIKRMKEEEEELEDEKDNQFFQDLASQKRESDAKAEAEFRSRHESLNETKIIETSKPALDEEYEVLPDSVETNQEEKKADIVESLESFDEADVREETEVPAGGITLAEAEEDSAEAVEKPAIEEVPDTVVENKEKAEIEMQVERAVSTGNIPGVQAALEAALDTQQIQRHVRRAEVIREPEEEQEALAAEEIELAMPVHTVDEYLQKAYAAGQDPVVRKDELTGVTYVDFSECI